MKADGEETARRYVPHWVGGAPAAGGGYDKKMVETINKVKVGSRVKLTTKDPLNGNRHFEGRLEHFASGRLTLDLAEARKKFRPKDDAPQKLEIELANVEKANLVPEI